MCLCAPTVSWRPKVIPFHPSAPFPRLSTSPPELIVNGSTGAFRKAAQSLVLPWALILGGSYMVLHTHRQLADCTPLPPLPPLSVCVLSLNTVFVLVTLHGTSNATTFNATMSHAPQCNARVTRCSSSVFIGWAADDVSGLFAYRNYGDANYGNTVLICPVL